MTTHRETDQQPRREAGVCPKCGHGNRLNGEIVHAYHCPERTGQQPAQPEPTFHSKSEAKRVTALMQPAQPGSGEVQAILAAIEKRMPWPSFHSLDCDTEPPVGRITLAELRRLQSALTAERGKLAAWMIRHNFVTGHGDTTDDLLAELGAQVDERAQRLTAAQQRIAALEGELENERARDIHTCHDQCERPLCVAQRRIRELEHQLAVRSVS
jgi:hypothetical protein